MHRDTRVIYRYFNLSEDILNYPNTHHHILQRGILFNKGLLYEKEQSNLKHEIIQRNRSFNKHYFT